MAQSVSPADCLALVERSPTAVAVHDRQAWLDLFASECVVEDPVGSAPQRRLAGHSDPLGPFYDTFIAANDIRFLVERDIVCGLRVVRDLSLQISMPGGLMVTVPMHLLYELTEEQGGLRIARLAAHWELQAMLRQQIALRWVNLKAGIQSFLRMYRHLGVSGIAGFMRARTSVGGAGKQTAMNLVRSLNERRSLSEFFAEASVIEFPHGGPLLCPQELLAQGGDYRFSKLLAAGNFVSASCTRRVAGKEQYAVAFFEFNSGSLAIRRLSFYW